LRFTNQYNLQILATVFQKNTLFKMSLQTIPFCIIRDIIFPHLDFHSQTNFRMTCKRYYQKKGGGFVLNHHEIPKYYLKRLTNEILSIHNITTLDAADYPKITDINGMTRLKILYAENDCGIGDRGIKRLNLVKLCCNNNPKITNVSHMTNLRILEADGICGIGDEGIAGLKLEKFSYDCNTKITNQSEY
jgi:hypothetical protein